MFSKEKTTNEVFGQINKMMSYGAPELIQFYQKYVARGLLISVAAFIFLSVLSFGYISIKAVPDVIQQKDRIITMSDLKIPPAIDKVTSHMQKDFAVKDLSALAPEPVARKFVEEEVKIKSNKELEEVKLLVSSEGADDKSEVSTGFTGKIEEEKVKADLEKSEEKIKDVIFKEFEVEKAPVPVNFNSLKGSIEYPESAIRTGTEGKVIARVLVGTDGTVLKLGKLTGPKIFYDEVSSKVMELQFVPALLGNQNVKCWVNVPFNFKLNSNK